ncbi:hypothetical protein AAIG96_36780, partial [Pseudomonas aeruginosa]
ENEVEQNDDGTYSQYGKKRVEGYEISVAGNITPARLAPNGRFWINACYLPPRCSVLILKMKLSKMMTGLIRNMVRNVSKATRYPWPGISPPHGR